MRGTAASLTAPAGISAGDTELLFVTTADTVTTNAPTGLTGWTQLAQQVSGPMVTTVYRRTAAAADSGTSVGVSTGTSTDIDLQMVDYAGVALNPLVQNG